jgi:hypothetical protein
MGIKNWWKNTITKYVEKKGWFPAMKTEKEFRTLNEYYLWYDGKSTNLSNYYSNFSRDTVKGQFFWSVSYRNDIKKTHSGLPMAIIDTVTNVTGVPEIMTDEAYQERLNKILIDNDFDNLIKQEQVPLTMVTGYGAFFVNYINEQIDIQFVDGRYVEIEKTGNTVTGIIKRTTLDEKYTLVERRSFNLIEYQLYKEEKRVSLSEHPESAMLEDVIINVGMIPAVAVRFKAGTDTYGRSLFHGKIDLFDDFDQSWSQLSNNVRSSGAITYMPASMVEVDKKTGQALQPDVFGAKHITTRGDKMEIIQPQIFSTELLETINRQLVMILGGTLSPSSLGFELTRTPNAEAQREREKVTLVTRDDIIDNETQVIKKVLDLALRFEDAMLSKAIGKYDIQVAFADYASPTFNERVNTLIPILAAAGISIDKFVEELWAGDLQDEELAEEIDKIKEMRAVNMDELMRSFTPGSE